jgi:hypothetical protein
MDVAVSQRSVKQSLQEESQLPPISRMGQASHLLVQRYKVRLLDAFHDCSTLLPCIMMVHFVVLELPLTCVNGILYFSIFFHQLGSVRVASADQMNPMEGALLTFVVGAGQAIEWLDECVRGIRKGSVISVSRFDEGGSSGGVLHRVVVVGIAHIVAGSRLESLGPASSESTVSEETAGRKPEPDGLLLSTAMCAKKSEECRTAANRIVMEKDVSMKKLRSVISIYHEALEWNRRALESERDETTVRILLNIALVLGKLGDWKTVLLYCDAALDLDPENAKGYFRRGQAGSKLGFHIRSIKDLERAAELSPDDPVIRAELSRAKLASTDLLKKTRRQFAEVYNVMVQSPIYKTVDP